MLKPVAAVGGALALVGAGAIGSISLMENFVIAGINGEAACDENPVGQVGPFKSTLDFGCTKDSTVTTGTGATVAQTYANFVEGKLESVPTSEFWPLFPVRNTFGLKPSIEQKLSDGLNLSAAVGIKTVEQAREKFFELLTLQTTGQLSAEQQVLFDALSPIIGADAILAYEFETCEKAYGTAFLGDVPYGLAVLDLAVEGSTNITARIEDEIKNARKGIEDGNDLLTGIQMPDFFGRTFCTGTAQQTNLALGSQALNPADCDNVVDYVVPNGDELAPARSARISANPDAKSFVEVVEAWIVQLVNPALEGVVSNLKKLTSSEVKSLALLCQKLQYPALKVTAYTALSMTPNDCKLAFSVGGPADETFKQTVEDAVRSAITSAVVDGITGVPVTNLTDPDQVAQLVVKCKEQEEDLAAIEQAQILLPGGAAAAGLAALLLFAAVATAKAPVVLAGGFLGVVGGVVTLVALLGVKNAPVYANVGGVVKPGEVEYKQGLGATLGLVGIGAPVIGGLLGVGSFFCGSDEGGNELSSKVDNTY